MLKIAITGNIASGKSEAENIIKENGYIVIDTDKINNDILINNAEIINQIKTLFKNYDILNDRSEIDKNKLGAIVFSDKELKNKLEKILHKAIWEEIENIFKKNEKEKIIFVSVPLLFEAGWRDKFDKVIFVSADEKLRLDRLIERNNYTKEYAELRIKSQAEEKSKIEKSDFVIYNNADFSSLKQQTNNILDSMINL